MARRGGSRASNKRRKAWVENKRAARNSASVAAPSPVKATVRRRVIVDPGLFVPGRRLSDLPAVSRVSREYSTGIDPSKTVPARPASAKPSKPVPRRRVSLNPNVAAYRAAELDNKPGSAASKAWRDNQGKDEKRPAECHPRPERVAKPPTAGGGSAPAKFVNWCK